MAQNRNSLILALARRMGIRDPMAALAVASAEGLSGGIGDAGTSFGPWQLHRGGALPGRIPLGGAHRWAWSPQGLNYALAQIKRVAGGLTGQQAIANIVRRFERPAAPGPEIQRALDFYLKNRGRTPSGAVAPSVGNPVLRPPGSTAVPPPPVRYRPYSGPTPGRALADVLMAGGEVSEAIPRMLEIRRAMASAKTPLRTTRPTPPPKPLRPAKPTETISVGAGGLPRAKIIGTPYAGTHTIGNWQSDNAIDLALPFGTPIRAVHDGVIGNRIGAFSDQPRMRGQRVNLIWGGNAAYYAHLSKLAVQAGQHVKKGQIIGYSGEANGVNHLHFGVQKGNPYAFTARKTKKKAKKK